MTSDLSLKVKNSLDGQSDNDDNNATSIYLSHWPCLCWQQKMLYEDDNDYVILLEFVIYITVRGYNCLNT